MMYVKSFLIFQPVDAVSIQGHRSDAEPTDGEDNDKMQDRQAIRRFGSSFAYDVDDTNVDEVHEKLKRRYFTASGRPPNQTLVPVLSDCWTFEEL